LLIAYARAGKSAEAFALVEDNLAAARKTLRGDSLQLAVVLYQHAVGLLELKAWADAEPILRECLAIYEKRDPNGERTRHARRMIGEALLGQAKYADAAPLLRQSLAIQEEKEPDAWQTFRDRSRLGEAIRGQGQYAEAEPLLVQGYQGMKEREAKIPPRGKVRLTEALERLVRLYEDWNRPAEAARWREKLEARKGNEK
jgi:tetratricopeptide (TPR) repeat protein